VHVKLVGILHHAAGVSDIWLSFNEDKVSAKEVFTKLEKEKGVKPNIRDSNIIVLINGRHMEYIGGLDAELKDSDEIVVTPIVGAG
jgi:molybdopterin converting factor small subunit